MEEVPTYYFALVEDLEKEQDYRFLPTKGDPDATGWDVRLYCQDRKNVILRPGQKALLSLGFRSFCPPGWWYSLFPRSSTFHKKSLHCLYGVIDQTWEGVTSFSCQYLPDINNLGKDLILSHGEAIAQIIPTRRQEMNVQLISNSDLDIKFMDRNSTRKNGGFGSTSK